MLLLETDLGVSIAVKGSTTGTDTDFDGMYNLNNVAKGTTLVFSYLGYKSSAIVVD
ncbi:carboxypeptidase-like regulatory domain-containing protein [Polaribacter sp. HL-MS24]|uniref:carboxypeptidase-like regulatory domain-containing protein n=1 Tax=Polaribacter sp. HL-MS24 TaxID=3077735 RepID=UPI002935073A|nr:carboxypeptidase-like regulatory domain-containing protein [Polaribacter sp. HL-MS24]WOC40425.1 carboxypeptidase-like regulatory domain-containing protein [Polaribacter sp. HL-MS24]